MQKKILIVSSVFKPEPVVSARISEDIATVLASDYEVEVFTPYPSRPRGMSFKNVDLTDNRFKRIIANSYIFPDSKFLGRMRESFSFGYATYKYIKHNKDKFSVIYANTKPLFGVYFTLIACKKFNIPLILHIQDIYPESMISRLKKGKKLFNIFTRLDKTLYKFAHTILVISDKMKEYISETRDLQSEKIVVARNWQGDLDFNCTVPQRNNKFTFMFCGSISPAAGVDFLIDSFIDASLDNCVLIIAGDGSMKEKCQEIVLKRGADNIIFKSVQPHEVPSVQSLSDVLLLPLKKGIGKTASPSKLPAYMQSGKPIIASVDSGCDTEFVINSSGCGLITEAENKGMLIQAMKTLSQTPRSELKTMGEKGKDFALHHMSKEVNLNRIVNQIKSAIK